MRVIIVAVLAISLTGCTGLLLKPEDGVGKKTAKVATRVVLGIGTIWMHEGILQLKARNRREQAERQLEKQRQWEAFLQRVRGATNITEITRVMGDAPRSCIASLPGRQLCTWQIGEKRMGYRTSGGVYGYAYGATYGETTTTYTYGEVVVAVCEVYTDGSPREPGSCQVSRR